LARGGRAGATEAERTLINANFFDREIRGIREKANLI